MGVVASMTGFAARTGSGHGIDWTVEVKSVNGRGLDVRCRMPSGFDRIEPAVRRAASKLFHRGTITLSISVTTQQQTPEVTINEALMERLLTIADSLKGRGVGPLTLDGLFGIRGVLETGDADSSQETRDKVAEDLAATAAECLEALAESRREEGTRLAGIVSAHLADVDRLSGEAARLAETVSDTLASRLREQLDALLAATPPVPEERLAQEIALLAVKADIREEIDRLRAHTAAARDLMEAGGAIGRRLDFLCQEFNREANTLCSKAADVQLTRVGLQLKATIDQFREQVQNIE